MCRILCSAARERPEDDLRCLPSRTRLEPAHRLGRLDHQIHEPAAIGAYRFLGLQREWIDPASDNLSEDFTLALANDPFWRRLPGPEAVDQVARWQPARRWLEELGIEHVDIDFVSIDGVVEPMYDGESNGIATMQFRHAAETLEAVFRALDPEERAVVVYLHNALQGAVTHALALATGRCTDLDFASGVGAAHGLIFKLPDMSGTDHSEAFAELKNYARSGLDYIAAYRVGSATERLLQILEADEGGTVEFKSTLRFDLKERKKNKALTDVVVKTVAGFVNTEGGTLLIGVADDGTVIGIDADEFDNNDAFLRHLYTSLTNAMGPSVTPLVNARIVDHRGASVALVECRRGTAPFRVKGKDGSEKFYARTGPATLALSDEQIEEWLQTHWK